MKIAKTLAWQSLGNDYVFVDLKAAKALGMNASAGRIIEWLSQGLDLDAMVEAMTAEFDVSTERASEDIGRFLSTLRGRGLVIE